MTGGFVVANSKLLEFPDAGAWQVLVRCHIPDASTGTVSPREFRAIRDIAGIFPTVCRPNRDHRYASVPALTSCCFLMSYSSGMMTVYGNDWRETHATFTR
jgi:hypothetical protein